MATEKALGLAEWFLRQGRSYTNNIKILDESSRPTKLKVDEIMALHKRYKEKFAARIDEEYPQGDDKTRVEFDIKSITDGEPSKIDEDDVLDDPDEHEEFPCFGGDDCTCNKHIGE